MWGTKSMAEDNLSFTFNGRNLQEVVVKMVNFLNMIKGLDFSRISEERDDRSDDPVAEEPAEGND